MFGVYRRNLIEKMVQPPSKNISTTSVSTDGSDSPRHQHPRHPRRNKEKLELCKKFTEFGYCPYEGKCKFAHGYHELRKDNTTNCKYKTKECVTYFQDSLCHYGSRCNFIHSRETVENEWGLGRKQYREVFQNAKSSSIVMKMLSEQ